MATTAALLELGPGEFLGDIDVMLDIYADAMDADAALLPGRRELMRRHAGYPGFRALQMLAAPARTNPRGRVIGFSYGFRGQPGQWWYDAVSGVLARTLGAELARQWLADSLEVAEVHVRSDEQRCGLGTRMLTALTAGPERTAVLSTPDRDTTARRLYRRMGFADLVTGYSFPGGSPPYAVMGAVLPLRDLAVRAGRPTPASPPRSASPSAW